MQLGKREVAGRTYAVSISVQIHNAWVCFHLTRESTRAAQQAGHNYGDRSLCSDAPLHCLIVRVGLLM